MAACPAPPIVAECEEVHALGDRALARHALCQFMLPQKSFVVSSPPRGNHERACEENCRQGRGCCRNGAALVGRRRTGRGAKKQGQEKTTAASRIASQWP